MPGHELEPFIQTPGVALGCESSIDPPLDATRLSQIRLRLAFIAPFDPNRTPKHIELTRPMLRLIEEVSGDFVPERYVA